MPGTLEDYAVAVTSVISICRDAEQGFRAAADAVKQPVLKEMFERYSEQRDQFATHLQEAIKSMGFDTKHPAGAGGMLHGAWMSVKGVLTRHDEHAILVETERGENWSVNTYREALEKNLPVAIRSLIEQQYDQVKQARDHIYMLADATAPKETTPEPPSTAV